MSRDSRVDDGSGEVESSMEINAKCGETGEFCMRTGSDTNVVSNATENVVIGNLSRDQSH